VKELLPESIPSLKGKDAKRFEKKAAEPPSEATRRIFQKAQEIHQSIERV